MTSTESEVTSNTEQESSTENLCGDSETKRYLIIVQHEIVMYAGNEKEAEKAVLRNPFFKDRTNLRVTYISEIPLTEKLQAFEDYRKAPGA